MRRTLLRWVQRLRRRLWMLRAPHRSFSGREYKPNVEGIATLCVELPPAGRATRHLALLALRCEKHD